MLASYVGDEISELKGCKVIGVYRGLKLEQFSGDRRVVLIDDRRVRIDVEYRWCRDETWFLTFEVAHTYTPAKTR
jgi:hypothetical protein